MLGMGSELNSAKHFPMITKNVILQHFPTDGKKTHHAFVIWYRHNCQDTMLTSAGLIHGTFGKEEEYRLRKKNGMWEDPHPRTRRKKPSSVFFLRAGCNDYDNHSKSFFHGGHKKKQPTTSFWFIFFFFKKIDAGKNPQKYNWDWFRITATFFGRPLTSSKII